MNYAKEKEPKSKPSRSVSKLHPKVVEPKSKKRVAQDVFGDDDMSDGPVPPTPPHAVKSPRTPINLNNETN